MKDRDVTNKFETRWVDYDDDIDLDVSTCACGAHFESWEFPIPNARNRATECPKCGGKFYFVHTVAIHEVR